MRSASGRTSGRALLASAGVNVRATKEENNIGRLIAWSIFVAFLIAVQYASRFSQGTPDRNVLYRYSTAAGAAVVYLTLLGVVVAIAGGRRDLLALYRPRSWPRALGLAAALLIVVYVAIALIDPFLHAGREQGLTPTGWQSSHAGAFAANFLVIAVLAPIVEELTFRGLGFSLLEQFGAWTAIVIVGTTFALAHGLVQAFPELLLFGSALAWLRWRTGSVYPGMLVHGAFNSIALVAAVTVHH
jgi:membrane protease YdiL (CAAX protease family)